MYRKIIIPILLLLSFTFSCTFSSEVDKESKIQKNGWTAVFKHDETGRQIEGSIDSLIAGIRNGYDLRVGWGWEKEISDSTVRLEHIAEPIFLTVIQEKNVSVVIDAHPLLGSYIDIHNQKFSEGGHIWQCVISTEGEFNAQVHHRSTGELIRDWPQKQRMTWFLEYPTNRTEQRKPLYQ